MSTPARTIAAIQARRANTQQMLQRVRESVIVLRRQKTPLTYSAVARRAAVSRTFLYENPDARSLVADAIAHTVVQRGQTQTEPDEQQEATWRERALNAEDALKTAHTEIRTQRGRIAQLMGQARDQEQEWSPESIAQVTNENTTLKQRIRQLAQDNRELEERLQAARSNTRFQDRRIAQMEAELLEQQPTGPPPSR